MMFRTGVAATLPTPFRDRNCASVVIEILKFGSGSFPDQVAAAALTKRISNEWWMSMTIPFALFAGD